MSVEEQAKPIAVLPVPSDEAAVPAVPRPKRRKAAPPPPPTARQALRSLGEEIRAARRLARSNGRVGWGLFRDDVRRGRIIDLVGLALLLALAVSLATSGDYQVQTVTVVNAKSISNEQAARMTGLVGSNIFLVDPAKIAARMRQSPFIKDATVETTLPDAVTIRVDERRPNVVWVLIDNTPYLISDDGVIISQAPTLQGYVVVYDKDTRPGALHLGDKLERQDVVDVAQGLFMRLPRRDGAAHPPDGISGRRRGDGRHRHRAARARRRRCRPRHQDSRHGSSGQGLSRPWAALAHARCPFPRTGIGDPIGPQCEVCGCRSWRW